VSANTPFAKALRTIALALATAAVALLAYTVGRRVAFPYDLEWMEGGMLTHSLRLLEGKPIYAPPSVDFVPYLYTPFYPALVAALAKVVGLGYLLGRAVSVVSFVAALVLGYVFARREGGSRATAFIAMALPAAAFVPTGAWVDLARPDSLFLGLTATGLLLGWWKRRSHAGVAVAAALLVAAFFTKQTASPFMIALGLALLIASPRRALTYGATLALLGLPLLWICDRASDGWFWTYISKLHRQHDFYWGRALLGSPVRLLLLIGPAALLVPWALARRRSPGLVYATLIALAGAAAACVGFGTQWAFTNAFLPGIYFPSIAIGIAAGRLATADPGPRRPGELARDGAPPKKRPAAVYLILIATLFMAPGGLLPRAARFLPHDWAIWRDAPTGYDPRPFIPTAEDRRRGDALLAKLRATPGEVLIPFHPFYGFLAGKRTWLHRMGVLDVTRAGMGPPKGLVEAIAERRFAMVMMDYKIDGNWFQWPGLEGAYRRAETVDGPRCVSGADTAPRYVLLPRIPTPPPPAPTAPAPVLEREP